MQNLSLLSGDSASALSQLSTVQANAKQTLMLDVEPNRTACPWQRIYANSLVLTSKFSGWAAFNTISSASFSCLPPGAPTVRATIPVASISRS